MAYDLNWTAVLKSWAIIPKVGGAFSIIGSCLILRDIRKKWPKVPLTTEVITNITVANLFIAFWECFLSTWMVPKDTLYADLTAGNTATCEAQGFIAGTMFIVLELSYAVLAILYWIIVARGWNERHTQRRSVRFLCLGLPLIIALAFSIPALFLEWYNFDGAYTCGIEEYPKNCDVDPATFGVCTRGPNARTALTMLCIFAFVCTVIILVFMCLLVRNVRIQEAASDRYLSKGQKKQREMTQKTFWQGLRLFLVFFITNLPRYIYAIYDLTRHDPPTTITFIYVIVWPLFGVFNSFAYFRPRYLSYRQKNPEKSMIHCLFSALDIHPSFCSRKSDESIPPISSDLMDYGEDFNSPLFREEFD